VADSSANLIALERRALDLMKASDFGDEAVRVNADIVALDPNREAAWTRLGRCHLEQREFDAAVTALRAALSLNPSNPIATRLLAEVRKQRALTPTATERATTGFSTREFSLLESLSPEAAIQALRPRIEALFEAVNGTSVAARIVEARRRQGETATKLFHTNSCHPGARGHIYAYHYGGRWEPQFNLGWSSSPPLEANCVRIGLGFNCSPQGQDQDRVAGQERALLYFERFQQALEKSWARELAKWMGTHGGFIQYADHPPATDFLPERAVEWLVDCHSASALGWIFVGRWLFLDKSADARILGDRAKLASAVDDTFRALYPIWLSTYATTPAS
jgi:tetratricopeptide (TPR) repeat protein